VPEAINIVWKFAIAAQLVLAARLLLQGLAGEYPALFTANCILPLKSLVLLSLFSRVSRMHGRQLSENLQPLEWILSAWIVFELFSRWTGNYAGIGRFGKILLGSLLAIALLLSVAFWRVEWQALDFAHEFKFYYILNRVIWGTLALFVLGTWLFFRSYDLPIAPNVARHTQIAVVYFVVGALCLLVINLYGLKVVQAANLAIVTSSTCCYSAWAVLLTKRGQVPPPGPHIDPKDKERIEQINHDLLVFMGDLPKSGR
jgi:hypothetical protein